MRIELVTPEGKILMALARRGGEAKTTELLEETALPKPTFYNKIKLLEALGYVTKVGNKVKLTSQGRAKVESLVAEITG